MRVAPFHRKGARTAAGYIVKNAALALFWSAAGEPRSASLSAKGLVEASRSASRAGVPWIDLMTMPEVAGLHSELHTLASIYDVTEFSFKLEQSRHVTALMPTNEAFERRNLPRILPCLGYNSVQQLLQSMIFEEPFKASELPDGQYTLKATSGLNVTVLVDRAPDKLEGWNSTDDSSRLSAHPQESPRTGAQAASGLIIGDHLTPEGNRSRTVVTPTVTFSAAKCAAKNIDGFLDTANGIAYIVDAVLVPPGLEPVLEAASLKCAVPGLASGTLLRPASVPRHVELTNQHHWFWGRLGGTPADTFFEPGKSFINKVTDLSTNAADQQSPRPPQTVGVLQRRSTPPISSGVLGRR